MTKTMCLLVSMGVLGSSAVALANEKEYVLECGKVHSIKVGKVSKRIGLSTLQVTSSFYKDPNRWTFQDQATTKEVHYFEVSSDVQNLAELKKGDHLCVALSLRRLIVGRHTGTMQVSIGVGNNAEEAALKKLGNVLEF